MKSTAGLAFALVTLCVMECYVSAVHFKRKEEPRVTEHDSPAFINNVKVEAKFRREPSGHHPGNQRGSPFRRHHEPQRGPPFDHHHEPQGGPPFRPNHEPQRGLPFEQQHEPQRGSLSRHLQKESQKEPQSQNSNNNNVVETLYCEYGKSSCECNETAEFCIFNLEIDEIQTFTSYEKLFVNEPTGIATRGFQGVGYYFNESGIPVPVDSRAREQCATLNNANCTSPQFVDGKTYRMAIAVNGQIPGPTLIVHEGQNVIVHVHNNLTTEGISVHWHGIHQRDSPYMDGVGQVTQCQIGPSSSFSYQYKASPAGTFWYHSHSGTQRTDGFFGGLIVKEKKERMENLTRTLNLEFEDLPDRHTLTLIEWQNQASLDLFTQFKAGRFYADKPIGEVPTPDYNKLRPTVSFDKGGAGPIPYFSGIINGKGRHPDVPYPKTRLSIFTVKPNTTYRFRLIGAQEEYAYKFSIDGHKLTVVATDGYWIKPIDDVDYIIIQTGERYDFLLNAKDNVKDYWIRAETLEIDQNAKGPPYPTLNHVAEAILHYKGTERGNPDDDIPSTEYESIKNNSPARHCSKDKKCKAVNCPFEKFHPSYDITCINVQKFSLLEPTPDNELPKRQASCQDCTHFINFNFEGSSTTSSVNGRNFILPSFPPQTQNQDFLKKSPICNNSADCNPSTIDCSCAYKIDIPYNETVQFVFSNVGGDIKRSHSHPIHLHGHSFHVVHVGYPKYNQTTGFVKEHNKDIFCDDVNCKKDGCDKTRCTRPSWAKPGPPDFSISDSTVRKDTVTVPAGGYVVINFISDNPGHWFLHCHIDGHLLEGMALIVNEASEEQKKLKPPPGIEKIKCGDFELPDHTDIE